MSSYLTRANAELSIAGGSSLYASQQLTLHSQAAVESTTGEFAVFLDLCSCIVTYLCKASHRQA